MLIVYILFGCTLVWFIADFYVFVLNIAFGLSIADADFAMYASLIYLAITAVLTTLASTLEEKPNISDPKLTKLFNTLSTSLWKAFGLIFFVSVLIAFIGRIASSEYQTFAFTIDEWRASGTTVIDHGSDTIFLRRPERSPILLDLQNNQSLHVILEKSSGSYGLLRQHGYIDKTYFINYPLDLLLPKVSLRSNALGKHLVLGVEYIEFKDVPPTVQKKFVEQLEKYEPKSLLLYKIKKAYPSYQ